MGTMETQSEKYTFEAELCQNEHFTLYQGRHTADNTPVIIKVAAPLYVGDDFFVRRFKQVAEQVAQLEHPNILRTYAAGEEGDHLYIAYDDPAASTLVQIIELGGPFSPQRMQHIAGQIASALDYAHQKGVFHGDLSAQHIYLGPNDHVFIANFGQSQVFFGANITKHQHAITSPEILAPERVHGQGPSRQADLYALGVLCYQMLTGKPPFIGPVSSVLHAQAHKQPLPAHLVNARVSIGISKVLGRMLSKGMELRYNTGAEFNRALIMAKHDSKPVHRYDHLMPITEREQIRAMPFKTFFYFVIMLIMIIFFSALFGWAGYELALKQAAAQTTAVRVVAAATIVALQTTPGPKIIVSTRILSSTGEPLPTGTSTEAINTKANTLLPTRGLVTALPTPSPTLSPTLSYTPTPSPTPLPPVPASQTRFIFKNPTGYDLIIDLTGPLPWSELIPPGQQQQFLLPAGSYQYIVHTPTGEGLKTVVGNFDLFPSQTIEKDYYSDYDWSQE